MADDTQTDPRISKDFLKKSAQASNVAPENVARFIDKGDEQGLKLTLAEVIDLYITSAKISQRELAKRMNTTHPTLNKFFNQEVSPTLEFLVKLSEATGITLTTLLGVSFPELVRSPVSPSSMFLAQLIEGLSDDKKRLILSIVGSKF